MIKSLIIKIKNFLLFDIWKRNRSEKSPISDFLINQFKIILITIRGFMENKVVVKASALTYYTMLSLIPVVAMAFGIAKGFGFEKVLRNELKYRLEGQKEVYEWVSTLSNRMLEHTKGGLIAGIGLIILIWTVMKVLNNVERSFNDVWEIKKGRTIKRKLSDYFTIVIISPIFVVISSSLTVYLSTHIVSISHSIKLIGFFAPVIKFLLNMVPYLLIWLLFTFIYYAIPNTKVKFRSAFIAGVVAGTLFQVVQVLYLFFQIKVSNYNALYGSFAALPLFMIWLQMAWLIVLFGAELSFATQNFRRYQYEKMYQRICHRSRRQIALLITSYLCKRFANGKPAATIDDISTDLDIPQLVCKELVYRLTESGILSEVIVNSGFSAYQPAVDVNIITIQFVISRLDQSGAKLNFLEQNEQHQLLNGYMLKLEEVQNKAEANILLKDL